MYNNPLHVYIILICVRENNFKLLWTTLYTIHNLYEYIRMVQSVENNLHILLFKDKKIHNLEM